MPPSVREREREPLSPGALATAGAAMLLIVFGGGGDYEQRNPTHALALLAGALALGGALLRARWAGWVAVVALAGVGVALRAHTPPFAGSDVLAASREAVQQLRAGHDPYAHTFAQTQPPGAPFAYPPGEIVFYLLATLGGDRPLVDVERVVGALNVVVLAALAPLSGAGAAALAFGAVALSGDVIFRATDGSNDTSAAFLVVVAVAALAWARALRGPFAAALWWFSAVAVGWAVAFKEYALPLAAVMAYFVWRDEPGGRRWTFAALGSCAVLVVPFVAWNPAAFVRNVGGALFVHPSLYGRNLWNDVIAAAIPSAAGVMTALAPYAALAALLGSLALVAVFRARTLGIAVLQGCAVIGATFGLSRWTTIVYFMFLLPPLAAGLALTLGERVGRGARIG